ncbi:uncharacterized protein IWZ02DRAFT_483370 [Phyllosticta citriasiana]|uniref:uncharacterized protein n=1 Tax=Phyllosticta citriasiana TaxID=595635 RepID=UPI0030FD28C4
MVSLKASFSWLTQLPETTTWWQDGRPQHTYHRISTVPNNTHDASSTNNVGSFKHAPQTQSGENAKYQNTKTMKKKKKRKKPDAVAAMMQNHRTRTKHIQPPVNQFNQSTGRPTNTPQPANTTNQPQSHSAQATELHDPDAELGMDGPRDGPKQRLRAPTHTRSTQHAARNTQHTVRAIRKLHHLDAEPGVDGPCDGSDASLARARAAGGDAELWGVCGRWR